MAGGYVHTGFSNWNLDEIFEYRVRKCFTYDTKRIRWMDNYELLKIFTKCAIEQRGIWSSPGGKYKKFTGSKSDLTYTWNYRSRSPIHGVGYAYISWESR